MEILKQDFGIAQRGYYGSQVKANVTGVLFYNKDGTANNASDGIPGVVARSHGARSQDIHPYTGRLIGPCSCVCSRTRLKKDTKDRGGYNIRREGYLRSRDIHVMGLFSAFCLP